MNKFKLLVTIFAAALLTLNSPMSFADKKGVCGWGKYIKNSKGGVHQEHSKGNVKRSACEGRKNWNFTANNNNKENDKSY